MGQKEPPRLRSTICYGQTWARKSHRDSAVRYVTTKSWPERATKTRQYDLLRPRVGQKMPPRLGSTICYGQELARKSHQDSAVRFVTAKFWPERATKARQYDLLRPRVGQKEPPRLGSTICYGQTWARKSHQDSAVRFVTAKSWPEKATETRQYDLLRPNVGQKEPPRLGSTICYGQELARMRHVGQKEPPRLGSTICYGQELARKSYRDLEVRFATAKSWPKKAGVRFVTAKSWPERVTKTRQYDLLRPRVGQKKPPRLGSTICYGQELARKSHQDSAVRLVTAKRGPERATKTRQYDLLRPNVGQKEPPRLGNTICYGQELAPPRLANTGPERAIETWQYDLIRPNVGQKTPPRLGSTICYGQELARKSHKDLAVRFVTANSKSHQDSAVRFVTAKRGPKRATKTRQYDLLQTCARKSQQDSAVRFVTAKSWPEKATKTRQYDMLRPRVGQKEPPRLGSTICYGQELARKSHQDSAVRFVTAKRWPDKATKTRQYDLLRPRNGQRKPPRLGSTICYGQQREPLRFGSTICYGQELSRKSHRDSAVRFATAKRGPERATKTRQYDLLRTRVVQKEPPRLGSTIRYGQTWARKSHQDSAVRFVTAKSWPERATETRQYDLLRPRVGQKEPPRLGSAICYLLRPRVWPERATKTRQYDLLWPNVCQAKSWPEKAPKTRQYDLLRPRLGQKEPPRLGSTICYGQELARKSHRDSAVRFVTAKRGPERATKTRQYDLLRPNMGQKEPPRLGSTICYGQELARKSHQDSAVRFVTKRGPERATKTRQYDLLRPRVGQKEPPRLGSTICYGQTWARKSHQDPAVRLVTAKRGPERATKTRQYDLLRPNVGQKEPPRLGNTICYGQELAPPRLGNTGPERATKTRQYDLLRPNVGQKEPPRLGSTICYGQELAKKSRSTICYGQELARKSHQDSAVRFITAKSWPEKATKTRQYDLLRPRVGQKEPPRLGSTTCYGQAWARKSHQDSAIRFVTAKRGPERATKTRQYDLLRPRVGPTKTRKYWARKSHQDSAVRFVTAKRGPEKATKTRQYDLSQPRVGQKKPPRLSSMTYYGQQQEPPRLGSTICYKRAPERATKTRQYDLLRPSMGQKKRPRLGSTICYGQMWAKNSHQDSAVRLDTTKSWPERATKTRQYDLLRPRSWPERATETRQYDLLRPNVG